MLAIDNCVWEVSDTIKINGIEVWNKNQLLMKQVLDDLGNMSYYPNGKKEHEKAVREILLSHGMVEKFKGKYGKGRSALTKPFLEKKKYPKGQYFIWQPHGSQSYPDFYLFCGGVKIPLECKSSKGKGGITWNSGYPREGGIYIFADGKQDKNYLFMGEDHWNPKQKKKWFAARGTLKARVQELKEEFDKEFDNTDFYLYFREMWLDRINIQTTDTDKKLKNVYDYFYKELK